MLNLQAVESLKKNNPKKKYMMVFGVESFEKELYFIATTGRGHCPISYWNIMFKIVLFLFIFCVQS